MRISNALYKTINVVRLTFKACNENNESAFGFYKKPKPGRSMMVRISSRVQQASLMEMAGLTDCRNGVRFYGTFIEDEKLLLFDMTKPVYQTDSGDD